MMRSTLFTEILIIFCASKQIQSMNHEKDAILEKLLNDVKNLKTVKCSNFSSFFDIIFWKLDFPHCRLHSVLKSHCNCINGRQTFQRISPNHGDAIHLSSKEMYKKRFHFLSDAFIKAITISTINISVLFSIWK